VAGILGVCMLHMAFLNGLAINGSKFMDSTTTTKLRAYCAVIDLFGAYTLSVRTKEAFEDGIYLVPFAFFFAIVGFVNAKFALFPRLREMVCDNPKCPCGDSCTCEVCKCGVAFGEKGKTGCNNVKCPCGNNCACGSVGESEKK